eukprot:15148253-Alexandrium_andersonii.AAC.1
MEARPAVTDVGVQFGIANASGASCQSSPGPGDWKGSAASSPRWRCKSQARSTSLILSSGR